MQYVLFLFLKDKKKPEIFDLYFEHEITIEMDFAPYYLEILKQQKINKENVKKVLLTKVILGNKPHNYILLVINNKEIIIINISTDDPKFSILKALMDYDEYIPKKAIGILLHKILSIKGE